MEFAPKLIITIYPSSHPTIHFTMTEIKDNYQLLIEKLDQFIRKYYMNSLIRGGLYSLALLLVLFLGLNFLEYHYYFKPGVRQTLFWSFVGISGVALFIWVALPLLRYFHLGKVISHEQAATIIGDHFTGVKDKLLNVLQLRSQSETAMSRDLILASINQKSEEIKPVPFRSAIDLTKNRKYMRYVLPPLLLLIFLLFAAPNLITDSTKRLVKYNKEFERPAPFTFVLENEKPEVVQYGEYAMSVKVEGDVLPNEVFINVDNIQYRLQKEDNSTFSYRFSNVAKDTDFKLFSSGVESRDYKLSVLKKPNITGFEVKLNYPNYTGRNDEELKSIGDLVVPMGTSIDWVFNAENTDDIAIRFSSAGKMTGTKRFSDELFTYKKRALKDETYRLYISNAALPNADSVTYSISVVPDLYPTISVEEFPDSTNDKVVYFVGEASDDYGLLSLSFNYRLKKGGKDGEMQTMKMSKSAGKSTQYNHIWDMNELGLEPGDELTYYFEVFDNDGVSGSKSARTNLMVFSMPTEEELEKMEEDNDQEVKDKLKESLEESKKIQDDMKKLREKVLQEKNMDWQTRKELEKLLERQKELEEQIKEAQKALEENMKNEEQFNENEEKQEMQEKLDEMMEDVMSDEMRDLMKMMEELMEKMEKDEALEMMEEMEQESEQQEKSMDRLLEMYKQLELEFEMQQAIEKLEELAKEQDQLAEETEKTEEENEKQNEDGTSEQEEKEQQEKQEELEEKQEELNEEFEKIEEKMEDIQKKNEELEKKKDIDDMKEEREDVKEDMQDSKENIQKKDNKKAGRKQKSAAQKMRKMANQMQKSMEQEEMEQMEEDMEALRQLLENIITLSHDEEGLMDDFKPTDVNTPRYVTLTQGQKKIQDDFQIVEDSLYALAKRVAQIESFITEKVGDIKVNMKKGLTHLEERQKPQAQEQQQRAMTNLNDLALMLSEVMNQMQMQMSSMMPGSQQCSNPGDNPNGKGKGQQPKDKMSEGQKGLNEGMKKMMKGMQEGGGDPSSKEFAEMAARQAALRKKLAKKAKEQSQKGGGENNELKELMEQMNKTEIDLVNKKLSNRMIKRQQDILTRMLEHEKAERQREWDDKRKSETAQDIERKLPPSLEEYIKKREAEIEQYRTVNPSLKPYYKQLVEEYYKSLKK